MLYYTVKFSSFSFEWSTVSFRSPHVQCMLIRRRVPTFCVLTYRPLAYIIEINKTAECYAVLFGGVVFRWIKSSATARTVASVSRDGNVAARLHFEALA